MTTLESINAHKSNALFVLIGVQSSISQSVHNLTVIEDKSSSEIKLFLTVLLCLHVSHVSKTLNGERGGNPGEKGGQSVRRGRERGQEARFPREREVEEIGKIAQNCAIFCNRKSGSQRKRA